MVYDIIEALSIGIAYTVSLSSQWVTETNDQHSTQPQPAQAMSGSESCLIFGGNTVNQQIVNLTSALRNIGEVIRTAAPGHVATLMQDAFAAHYISAVNSCLDIS
jgi:hypothetical protein